jgi:hypothetical protein
VIAQPHTHCRACGLHLPPAFLDLGMQPLANNLCVEPRAMRGITGLGVFPQHFDGFIYPMRLTRCEGCDLLQLDMVIDPAVLFSHYLYKPSQSSKTRAHFDALADAATNRYVARAAKDSAVAVDIGSNDGYLLGALKGRGWRVCGIDPAVNLVAEANAAGLPTICGFLDDDAVIDEVLKLGKAHLITANNVFAHTPDWAAFARRCTTLLHDDGEIAIEFPYGPTMLRDGTFDLIYFEHASYPAVGPVAELFRPFGIKVISVEDLRDIHGGSVRVWLSRRGTPDDSVKQKIAREVREYGKEACAAFAERVRFAERTLRETVRAERRAGRRVVGYTAPAKCVTLLTAAGLGRGDVACIVDDNPLKQHRLLPGLHVPIVAPEEAALAPGDTVIIFAWNVAEDIMSKLPMGVDVIVPMPTVEVIRR